MPMNIRRPFENDASIRGHCFRVGAVTSKVLCRVLDCISRDIKAHLAPTVGIPYGLGDVMMEIKKLIQDYCILCLI